jgi:threonine dehydratase
VSLPTLDDALAAQRRLVGEPLHRTPLWRSQTLSREVGRDVHLKLELLQKTGSFKPRGALVKIGSLTADERRRGVIAVSAGNHAQAIAYAAATAGVSSTVVTWETAPEIKLVAARAYGAETLRLGRTPLEAFEHMRELKERRGLVLAHPYDDPQVIAGQATVGLELVEDLPELATVVVPVGGGGLLGGIAIVLRALLPDVRIVGVEPEGAPTLRRALEAGVPVPLNDISTIADGLSAPVAGDLTLAAARLADELVTVSDDDLREAMRFLAARTKLVAEPAGAAAVAALRTGRVAPLDGPVVAVLSGGNVDPVLLGGILAGAAPVS